MSKSETDAGFRKVAAVCRHGILVTYYHNDDAEQGGDPRPRKSISALIQAARKGKK